MQAVSFTVVGRIVAFLLAVAGIMMYYRYCRDVRKGMTLQFMMENGFGSGKMVDSKDVVSDNHLFIFFGDSNLGFL